MTLIPKTCSPLKPLVPPRLASWPTLDTTDPLTPAVAISLAICPQTTRGDLPKQKTT